MFANFYFIATFELPEMDFDSMFATAVNNNPVIADPENQTVDIRDILGKFGRSTEVDKPVIIVTEYSKEKVNKARSHVLKEEMKQVSEEERKKKMLILDSRAFFLRKISVEALCHDRKNIEEGQTIFGTCKDVINELRDEQTRNYIQTLPFELELMDPSESALKFVVKFSKETGDYQSLSGTDLRVIALAYT
jgi:hypothetical protein